jgi:hypothetical protein
MTLLKSLFYLILMPGGVMILWSLWNLLVNGQGTPTPMDLPCWIPRFKR